MLFNSFLSRAMTRNIVNFSLHFHLIYESDIIITIRSGAAIDRFFHLTLPLTNYIDKSFRYYDFKKTFRSILVPTSVTTNSKRRFSCCLLYSLYTPCTFFACIHALFCMFSYFPLWLYKLPFLTSYLTKDGTSTPQIVVFNC